MALRASIWALPSVLRLALCAQRPFSIQNDLLAFPQYEVVFSESYISHDNAQDQMFPWLKQTEPDFSDIPSPEEMAQKMLSGDLSSIFSNMLKGKDTLEQMVLNGRGYLCTIPYVAPPSPENLTTSEMSQDEKQQELTRASDHGLELLHGMQGQCLYYAAGYWVYSFCYNQGVKQFHPLPHGRGIPTFPPVEDKSVHSFILGSVGNADQTPSTEETGTSASKSISTPSTQLQTHGEINYLVQQLRGGTVCDLTGHERRIDIQFHCNPTTQDRISMIKETASCVYLMVIHTPRLCSDVAFMPPQVDKPNAIICQEIVEDHAVDEWKARKSFDSPLSVFADNEIPPKQAITPLVIGGVILGGQRLVGATPERTIKMSNAMAAAQEAAQQLVAAAGKGGKKKGEGFGEGRYVATLAKSDGTYTSVISEKEMKKHGFTGDMAELQKWIIEMTAVAGDGVPWRLDVYETDEGMEFRGIYDEELSEDEVDAVGSKVPKKHSEWVKETEKTGEEEEGSQEEYKSTAKRAEHQP